MRTRRGSWGSICRCRRSSGMSSGSAARACVGHRRRESAWRTEVGMLRESTMPCGCAGRCGAMGDVVERGERGESEGRGRGRSDIAATAARSRSGARSAAMSAARFGDRTGRGARRSQRASIGNIGTSWILRVPVQASVSPPGRKGRMARQGTRESGSGREDSAAAVSPQAAWPPRATASDCCGSDRPPGPRCRSPDHPAAHG